MPRCSAVHGVVFAVSLAWLRGSLLSVQRSLCVAFLTTALLSPSRAAIFVVVALRFWHAE